MRSLLMQSRNEHVKAGLQNVYASEVPQGRLDVFCVSNSMYEKSCRKGRYESVQTSGIPELRRFCLDITANGQFSEATHFLQTTLPAALNSATLWASGFIDRESQELEAENSSAVAQALEGLRNSVRLDSHASVLLNRLIAFSVH